MEEKTRKIDKKLSDKKTVETKNVKIKKDVDSNEIEVKKTTRTKKKVVDNVPEEKPQIEIREVVVERKTGFNYAEVIVIMIITLILGAIIGSFVSFISKGKEVENGNIISEVPEDLEEFVNTYNQIAKGLFECVKVGSKISLNKVGNDTNVLSE